MPLDKLHGALAGYIMIAFLWTFIYALSEGSTYPMRRTR